MLKNELIEFEDNIAKLFNGAKIASPIHLYDGNEDFMIDIFKEININDDWVCATWRNHYQALLKGVPSDVLLNEIMGGKSMVLNLPEYKLICSSIVGGIMPIATGIALSLKLQNKKNHVWCWVGDMGAETGIFHESYKYAINMDLPITFIIEDNKKSVQTPTDVAWGRKKPYYLYDDYDGGIVKQNKLYYYQYENKKYPHSGAGLKVIF